MSTSLAEQLRRLATPQSSLYIDSKKRPSILFDPKEAANKDRKTIFDIGYAGLTELANLNPIFLKFENTLFDSSAINLERAVELKSTNKLLDKAIKQFFQYLSPFLMIQPAKYCLEWLIRRFNIHEYNRDDFIALILPYHETKFFVKCIQVLNFRDQNDTWIWLKPLKKPGVPLSKAAIFNRAASDPKFLRLICKSTSDAIKELDTKGYSLQVMLNFYCTTVIGALEYTNEVLEWHISNILSSILKGFQSSTVDFVAAACMITAQIVCKTKLSLKVIDTLIQKICLVTHELLQKDCIMLLLLIFEQQKDHIQIFPQESITNLINNKFLIQILTTELSEQFIYIGSFCSSILRQCLISIQSQNSNSLELKNFLENLFANIRFKDNEAEILIRTSLDIYQKPQVNNNDVIEINSDDEMDQDINTQKWYSNFLQKLERQYPSAFDTVVKEAFENSSSMSESRKNSLKLVLAFRLKSSWSNEGFSIYENLYHHSSYNRAEAIKFIVEKLNNDINCFKNDTFLKTSISDRLEDDSPIVLREILKIPPKDMIYILGIESTTIKILKILKKGREDTITWKKTIINIIPHINALICTKEIDKNIFLYAIMPFLLPNSNEEIEILNKFITSKLVKEFDILKKLTTTIIDLKSLNSCEIIESVQKILNTSNNLPDLHEILKIIKIYETIFLSNQSDYGYFLLFLKYIVKDNTDMNDIEDVLQILCELHKKIDLIKIKNDKKWISSIKSNKIPIKLFLNGIQILVEHTKFTDIEFNIKTNSFKLILKIFEFLLTNSFITNKKTKYDFISSLKMFMNTLFPAQESKMKFLSNFFIIEYFADLQISLQFQVRAIRLFTNVIDKNLNNLSDVEIFSKILTALSSKSLVIRECSLNCLQKLIDFNNFNQIFTKISSEILKRKEEIKMDSEQISLVFFIILSEKKSNDINNVVDQLIDIISSEKTDNHFKVGLLQIFKHISNENFINKILKIPQTLLNDIKMKSLNKTEYFIDEVIFDIIKMSTLNFGIEKSLDKNSKEWIILNDILKLYQVLCTKNNEITSISCIAMNIFTEELLKQATEYIKYEIIKLVIEAITYANHNTIIVQGGKLIKRMILNKNIIFPILEDMNKCCSLNINKRKNEKSNTSISQFLNTKEWKCGITMLEHIQNKKNFIDRESILPILFEIFNKCLKYEEQTILEYAKQLILLTILYCCENLKIENVNQTLDNILHVDCIVECMRNTINPQTRHHAILLLSYLAGITPHKVLNNMVNILTFMGSSMVRYDDSFSTQIISSLIESVIPTIVGSGNTKRNENEQEKLVIPVLKVFSSVLLDVPEHRRLKLYYQFINILDAKHYLWMFLCIVFETHIINDEKKSNTNTNEKNYNQIDELPKRIDIVLQLTKKFDINITIITCSKLLEYLTTLNYNEIDNKNKNRMEIDQNDLIIFDINGHSLKQLRHYIYIIIQFVNTFISSTEFVNEIARLNEIESKSMKPLYQELIIKILSYIPIVTISVENNIETNQLKYWKVILRYCYDILDNSISLLTPDMFLIVVHGLMNHKLIAVRKKVIELLSAKLQYKINYFDNCKEENLLKLLNSLNDIINNIFEKDESYINTTLNETIYMQQVALIAIKLLSKILIPSHLDKFKEILLNLGKILKKKDQLSKILLATIILTIAEICSNLKAHSIGCLSKFMSQFIIILNDQTISLKLYPPDNITSAIISSAYKLIEKLALFLGSYLENMITSLLIIWSRIEQIHNKEQKSKSILLKLDNISLKLSTILPLRLLVPICEKSFNILIETKEYYSIGYLMKILAQNFNQATNTDINSVINELSEFFLIAFEFRTKGFNENTNDIINKTEEQILNAFIALILKLSENSFRPLYHKVYDWAINNNSNSKNRLLTYFLLSKKIAESLKSLFILFANDFIDDAAKLLDICNLSIASEIKFIDSLQDNIILIENILKTLNLVFLYNNKNFINRHRFDILMQSIVNQIENQILYENNNLKDIIIECISQLAVAVNDDSLWKQLNYQILLKTRNNNPIIRMLAFDCCIGIAKKLEDDFNALLPETIPFIAELFEDENQNVENACRKGVQELEKILGESLQKYF